MANSCKMKTHTGSAKRVKRTGTGKIKFSHTGRRHLMTGKRAKTKRQMRGGAYAIPGDAQRFDQVLA